MGEARTETESNGEEERDIDIASGGREEGERRTKSYHMVPEVEHQKVDTNSVRQGGEKEKWHTGLGEQEEETDVWFDVDGELPPKTLLHPSTA
ncbi:hypothetical protein NDU88_001091 [Pleurodeles waltl]|uniref:Uncharacterized protein n=1 Tax=Pleurodeles waltl TaxID=8319 RepID=A0AAV7UT31_PLEWA|nr:hypothetical protein NDU88_001091 [Pleurodeles waltl]